MTKRRKFIALFAVLYFLFTLGLYRPVQRVWNNLLGKQKEIVYRGSVHIWHITNGNTGKIKDREMLSKFEKANFGIFVDTWSMSADQAREKLAAGEKPDVITYEPGFFADPKAQLEPLSSIDVPFADGGKLGGEVYAYPVLYDRYTFLVNEDLLYQWELEPPALMDIGWLYENISDKEAEGIKPIAYVDEGAVVHAALALGGALPKEPEYADIQAFAKGEVGVLVCSKLKAATTELDMPGHNLYDFGHFTNQVRYVSVLAGNDDENRLQCSQAVAKLYVEDKGQKAAAAAGYSVKFGSDELPVDEDVRLLSAFDHVPDKERLSAITDEKRAREIIAQFQDAVTTMQNML